MRVCSFIPAVTQMMYDMGLQDMLYGITFECPLVARKEKRILISCILEGQHLTSKEIDILFSAYKKEGKPLYKVDEQTLHEIEPDIIFTQDICDVCEIDTATVMRAVTKLKKQPQIVGISPASLQDVIESALTIAKALQQEEKGRQYVKSLYNRIYHVTDMLRAYHAPVKRVSLLEWIDPIYNCGHWIPHQIGYAGGVDMLSNPSGDSMVIDFEKIVKYNPDIIIVAPCGFYADRATEEMHLLSQKTGWNSINAVVKNRVYIVDFDLFTQPSAETLVQGIELLSYLFHDNIPFSISSLINKYRLYSSLNIVI